MTVGHGSDPTSQWQVPTPPPPPPPPYGAPASGPAPYGAILPAYPPAGRSGLPGWAIALIAAGGVLTLLIMAAVAIPVFLQQQARAVLGSTSVSLPPAVAGLPQVDDPAIRQQLAAQAAAIPTCGCTEPLMLTLYQDQAGTHRIVVMAGKFTRPASASAQRSISDQTWLGLRDGAAGTVTFGPPVDVDPGLLGGRVSCAPITAGTTGRACVSVDGASLVTMMEFAPTITDPTVPVSVREAVVHRG